MGSSTRKKRKQPSDNDNDNNNNNHNDQDHVNNSSNLNKTTTMNGNKDPSNASQSLVMSKKRTRAFAQQTVINDKEEEEEKDIDDDDDDDDDDDSLGEYKEVKEEEEEESAEESYSSVQRAFEQYQELLEHASDVAVRRTEKTNKMMNDDKHDDDEDDDNDDTIYEREEGGINPYDILDYGTKFYLELVKYRSKVIAKYQIDNNNASITTQQQQQQKKKKKKTEADRVQAYRKGVELRSLIGPITLHPGPALLRSLPKTAQFDKIYESQTTIAERVQRLKMITYVLNLEIPNEVPGFHFTTTLRKNDVLVFYKAFDNELKDVLTRLKYNAFACACHELKNNLEFLSEKTNLVSREMAKGNDGKITTLSNAAVLSAMTSLLMSLFREDKYEMLMQWQLLAYNGSNSSYEKDAPIVVGQNAENLKLDFDSIRKIARTLRKRILKGDLPKSPVRRTAPPPPPGSPSGKKEDQQEEMNHNLKQEQRENLVVVVDNNENKELQQKETPPALKLTTNASILTHHSLFSNNDSTEELDRSADIIGRTINTLPLVFFVGGNNFSDSCLQLDSSTDAHIFTSEEIKQLKAFMEISKLVNDVVSRLSAMAGDVYEILKKRRSIEETLENLNNSVEAHNLSWWDSPNFREESMTLKYNTHILNKLKHNVNSSIDIEYDQWLCQDHSEKKGDFCTWTKKLVGFFVVSQNENVYSHFASAKKDVIRTLSKSLSYHESLMNDIVENRANVLYDPNASRLEDVAFCQGHVHILISKLNILKQFAKDCSNSVVQQPLRGLNFGEFAKFLISDPKFLPLVFQLFSDVPEEATLMSKACGGFRSIALDLELSYLIGTLCEHEEVLSEVLNFKNGAIIPLMVTRLIDMLTPNDTQLRFLDASRMASFACECKNRSKSPSAGEVIQSASECIASMTGKVKAINDEFENRKFSTVLLKLLERKEPSVQQSVSAAIIAMGEHKKMIGNIRDLATKFENDGILSVEERDNLKSMLRSVTELVKESPTDYLPECIDSIVSEIRSNRWLHKLKEDAEEHVYDAVSGFSTAETSDVEQSHLRSFEEELFSGSLVKDWHSENGILVKFPDLGNALEKVIKCSTSDVLKFRNYYDEEEDEAKIKKTVLYKAIRSFARLFRMKFVCGKEDVAASEMYTAAINGWGVDEGQISETDKDDEKLGKKPTLSEIRLAETMVSSIANLRLEDACDVMVDERMIENLSELIKVLKKINERLATMLELNSEDPRVISIAEVLKEACYCMSLLAGKSCHQDRVATAGTIPLLVDIIKRYNSRKTAAKDPTAITASVARRAADAITNLAHENHEIKSTVRSDGGVPPLVVLLNCVTDLKVQRAAAAALRTLAFKNPENKNMIVEEGALKMLVFMVRSEDHLVHKEAVGVIGNLVHSSLHIKKRVLDEGALQPVISLLSSRCQESQREAALLLGQFAATEPDYKTRIVQRGAVFPLVVMLQNPDPGLREMAAFALGRLAQNADNQIGICFGAGLGPLLKLLDSKEEEITEYLRQSNNTKKSESEISSESKRYVENLQHNAAFALYGLADNEDNAHRIISEGTVQRLREVNLLVDASKTCVQKTLKRLEDKMHGKCLEYLRYLMLTTVNPSKKFRIASACSHLCDRKHLQEVFLESKGLDILFSTLTEHITVAPAAKRTKHLKGVGRVPLLKPTTSSSFNNSESIAAIEQKLKNAGSSLSEINPNSKEALDAIASLIDKTKPAKGDELADSSYDGKDFPGRLAMPSNIGDIEFFEWQYETDGGAFIGGSKNKEKGGLLASSKKLSSSDRNNKDNKDAVAGVSTASDLCDVAFVCASGRELRAHRIAFTHASEKFLKLVEAGSTFASGKENEKVFGAMDLGVGDTEENMDEDININNINVNINSTPPKFEDVMSRVKLGSSDQAAVLLLQYLYTGKVNGPVERMERGHKIDKIEMILELINMARRFDLDGLVREVEGMFKNDCFTVNNFTRIMYSSEACESETISKLGWQFAFQHVDEIIKAYGLKYFLIMIADAELELKIWLGDRMKSASFNLLQNNNSDDDDSDS